MDQDLFSHTMYCFVLKADTHTHTYKQLKVKVNSLSRVRLFATSWTVAYQAPPSVGFSRQEYWSGLPSPSPGDLPNPGIEPRSPALQAGASTSAPPGKHNVVGLNVRGPEEKVPPLVSGSDESGCSCLPTVPLATWM